MKNVSEKTVLAHVIGIVFFITYEMRAILLIGSNAGIVELSIFYLIDILVFYLTSYWYLPLIQEKVRNFIIKGFWYSLWIFAFSCLFLWLTVFLETFHGKYSNQKDILDRLFLSIFRRSYLFSIALGFWYARHSINKEREIYFQQLQLAEVRELTVRQENALLRAQVNPHLLFNALNGIYGLLAEKSPSTAKIALLLSDMMAFAIQEPEDGKHYALSDELDQVKRLIELHQLLHDGLLQLDVVIRVSDEAKDIEFPPLLIVNIVDNIFKHGDLTNSNKPGRVSIKFRSGFFEMETRNFLPSYKANSNRKGLGLENTKKRLEKHFPKKYEFDTGVNNNEEFVLQLYIKLER